MYEQIKHFIEYHGGAMRECPYACDLCDYSTTRQDWLTSHRASQHPDGRAPADQAQLPWVVDHRSRVERNALGASQRRTGLPFQADDSMDPVACDICVTRFRHGLSIKTLPDGVDPRATTHSRSALVTCVQAHHDNGELQMELDDGTSQNVCWTAANGLFCTTCNPTCACPAHKHGHFLHVMRIHVHAKPVPLPVWSAVWLQHTERRTSSTCPIATGASAGGAQGAPYWKYRLHAPYLDDGKEPPFRCGICSAAGKPTTPLAAAQLVQHYVAEHLGPDGRIVAHNWKYEANSANGRPNRKKAGAVLDKRTLKAYAATTHCATCLGLATLEAAGSENAAELRKRIRDHVFMTHFGLGRVLCHICGDVKRHNKELQAHLLGKHSMCHTCGALAATHRQASVALPDMLRQKVSCGAVRTG